MNCDKTVRPGNEQLVLVLVASGKKSSNNFLAASGTGRGVLSDGSYEHRGKGGELLREWLREMKSTRFFTRWVDQRTVCRVVSAERSSKDCFCTFEAVRCHMNECVCFILPTGQTSFRHLKSSLRNFTSKDIFLFTSDFCRLSRAHKHHREPPSYERKAHLGDPAPPV